jgi:hypothetical protein
LENGGVRTVTGQLTVDVSANNGSGNARGMVAASSSQKLQFCPYLGNYSNCFDVASFTSDAQGQFDVNFTFPKKGAQLGLFRTVNDPAGTETSEFAIGSATQTSAPSFRSALLPASLISGGVGTAVGTASLTQGSVAVTGNSSLNTVQITLTGAPPNDTFLPKLCLLDGVRCVQLSNFTTDSSGNAAVTLDTITADAFVVVVISDSQGVKYVGAFRAE